jgi:large subunit ribosomal protein L36
VDGVEGCGDGLVAGAGKVEVAMKVRSSMRSLARKPGSVVVRRRGRVQVVNRVNPRWNGRQG